MDLSIATHFSQGGAYGERKAEQLIELIKASGADAVRDGLSWERVETTKGVYGFDSWETRYIDKMLVEGLDPILTLMPNNKLYEKGATTTKAESLNAFADYVSAVLDRFPDLRQIAIGNEFNGLSSQFISGKAATLNTAQRAEYYTAILKAVHDRVSEDHPDVKIIGGALHSVPTGYVQHLADAGAFQYMDSLDIHPYGSDPLAVRSSLERLNTVLSQLPQDQRPELIATEFGQSAVEEDPVANANYLAKMAAVMGDAGVSEAVWYALLDEDYYDHANMGLYDNITTPNAMLAGYRYLAEVLGEDVTPQLVETETDMVLYKFGPNTWLAWGSRQDVAFSGNSLVFRNAAGEVIDRPDLLSSDAIFIEGRNLQIAASGPGSVIADSFYDFTLSGDFNPDTGWTYLALKTKNGVEHEAKLDIMDGQNWMNENWNPYLGTAWSRPFSINNTTLVPVGWNAAGTNERATLERYTAEATATVDIVGSWQVSANSTDGVLVEIRLNGTTLETLRVTSDEAIALRNVTLSAGDTVDFLLHDGGSSIGDATVRHIRILEANAGKSTNDLLAEHLSDDIIDGNEVQMAEPLPLVEVFEPAPAPAPVVKLAGSNAADILKGGGGRDNIFGRAGDDWLSGLGGNDILVGSRGDDTLLGGSGDDKLSGGAGEDRLSGGIGADILSGGKGADVFLFAEGEGLDTLNKFNWHEGDQIDLTAFELSDDSAIRSETLKLGHMLQVNVEGTWEDVVHLVSAVDFTSVDALIDEGALLF